jgi:hypothetical protein
MRHITKAVILSSLIFPGCLFALGLNSYFQQGITVDNMTSQNILVTDSAAPGFLLNYPVNPGKGIVGTYASDQFTVASGQTFSHTININSAVDYSLICTVKSNLFISVGSMHTDKPTSTDEKRCQTSGYNQFSRDGTILGGIHIDVMA